MWRAIAIRGTATTTGATLAWLMGRLTGTQRRAATIALIKDAVRDDQVIGVVTQRKAEEERAKLSADAAAEAKARFASLPLRAFHPLARSTSSSRSSGSPRAATRGWDFTN